MSLLERVATLIKANLNELLEKAESPETMIKQVIVDMENQLLQVKTQVAIAIADQHLLEKKQADALEKVAEWNRKAALAVAKNQDDLARAAIERSLQNKDLTASFAEQVEDQKLQVESLKNALTRLQQKLDEARAKGERLAAQHRRARTLAKAANAHGKAGNDGDEATLERIRTETIDQAKSELSEDELAERLAQLEKEDEINRILQDLKSRKGA